ncbi:MAG: VWA domain-containing protein [Planctomycetes bacterium]|nr:VWA domain-containing protein [Planctomycetota bacterium]
MVFAHPWALVFLVVPLWLIRNVWRRPRGHVVLPFDYGQSRSQKWLAVLLSGAESLPPLLLAVAIILCAVPLRLGLPRTRRVMTNIQFCVDVSGSMSSAFGGGTRYDASMEAINWFVEYREGDAFGLTFFGNQFLHWVPLTSDPSAFKYATPFMAPDRAPPGFGGTEIGRALLACKDQLLSRPEGDRMIILVSDGWSADLGPGRDEGIARTLNRHGITLFAVHVGDTDVPDSVAAISTLTGGDVFRCEDIEGLQQVFERIDRMKPAKFEKVRGEMMDHFRPYSLAGLGLLGLVVLTSFGLRYTPW